MSTVKLTDRNSEIINKIPAKYKNLILNNIITNSIENSSILKEAKKVLKTEDFDTLSKELGLSIEDKKIIKAKDVTKRKSPLKEEDVEENNNEPFFEGFS